MKILSLFLLISFPVYVSAEGLASPGATEAFSEQTMKLFYAEKFSEGLDKAKKYWPLPTVEIDALANQIKQQWPMLMIALMEPSMIGLMAPFFSAD